MTLATSKKLLDKFGSIRMTGQPEPADKAGSMYRVPFASLIRGLDSKQLVEQVIRAMPDVYIGSGPIVQGENSMTILIDTSEFAGDATSIDQLSTETLGRIYTFVYKTTESFVKAIDELADEVFEISPSDQFASTTSSSKSVSRRQSRPRSGPMASRR